MAITLQIIIGVVVAFLAVLNVLATVVVLNTYFEVKERRIYQLVVIWMVPILGAFLAIYLNREESFFPASDRKKIGNHTSISDLDATTHHAGSD